MSDDNWRRVEDLFHWLADLEPAERSRFLSREYTGDDEVFHGVQSFPVHDAASEGRAGAAAGSAVEELSKTSGSAGELLGKHVGGYLITELIGKGGMGVVFKARDTRLDRFVAIKALPPEYLADAERKSRFLREAKSASALNHPNIVTVYGIAEEKGMDFIIMEYVSGKTLDRLIPHKGLPLRLALKYSLEITDGILAAHTAGILHRDIKPSNIMVTEQDRVKILDFGLAKLTEPQALAADPALLTEPGLAIGTAPYMSPEQAEGNPADARSDIFSFGAVLYEMLAGHRAFQGRNAISVMAAVINRDPPPLGAVVANAPPELERIVARCLTKHPNRRIQHMGDVRLALEEVLQSLDSPAAAPASIQPRRRLWLVFGGLAVALALALRAWLGDRVLHKTPVTFQRLTFRQGDVTAARFGPGGTVVYAAKWDGAPDTLFSAQAGSREARDLGLPPCAILSISRSGEMLIRLSSRQTLAEVPLAGGEPREVLENVSGADWDPEGKSFAVIRSVGGHHRVEYPVGKVLYETQLAWPPMYARFSPKGDLLAFFDRTEVGDYSLTIVGPDHPRQVLSVGWRAIAGLGWSPDGREVWFSGGRTGTDPAVYAVNFSGRERMLVQIPGWASLYDIGSDGRFLLSNIDSRIGIRCLAPASRDERNLGWLDASLVQAISNDGKLILFNELASGEGRNTAIYLRRTDGSPAVRLGFGNQPALSPDCKSVLCIRREGNASQLVLLPTGPGEARTLPESGIRPLTAEWFPDGKQILITGMQANQPVRTYVKNLATGANRPVTAPGVTASGISPDGRLAVAMSPAGKVVLLSVDTGSETGVGVVDPGVSVIRWSGEGRYLFLKRVTGNRLAILRLDVRTGQTQVWRELKPFDAMASFFESVKLSADGSAYAYSFQRDSAILYLVTGVQ